MNEAENSCLMFGGCNYNCPNLSTIYVEETQSQGWPLQLKTWEPDFAKHLDVIPQAKLTKMFNLAKVRGDLCTIEDMGS